MAATAALAASTSPSAPALASPALLRPRPSRDGHDQAESFSFRSTSLSARHVCKPYTRSAEAPFGHVVTHEQRLDGPRARSRVRPWPCHSSRLYPTPPLCILLRACDLALRDHSTAAVSSSLPK